MDDVSLNFIRNSGDLGRDFNSKNKFFAKNK